MKARRPLREERLNKVPLTKAASDAPVDIFAHWLGVMMRKGEDACNTADFSDVYYMHALLVGSGMSGNSLLPYGFTKSEVDPPTLARMMYKRV